MSEEKKINNPEETLGSILKAKRLSMRATAKTKKQKKEFSLRGMGKKMDTGHVYLYNLETNKMKNPSPLKLKKLSFFYKIPFHTICDLWAKGEPKMKKTGPKKRKKDV